MSLTFGSWCSGIEAASAAFLPLGWECAYVAEIEPFPCAVLAQRYGAGRPVYMPDPETAPDKKTADQRRAALKALDRITWGERLTNWGDISQIKAADLPPVDLLCAGLPCQAFSIAGLRKSLADDRGNLTLVAVRLIHDLIALGLVRSFLFENVPAILNTPDNAFGCFLGAIVGADDPVPGVEHGGKWPSSGMVAGPRARVAWRVLDAQYFGLAQRRERVFAVADFGDGPDPAAVLFERAGVSRNPPARREAGEGVAPTLAARTRGGGGLGTDFDCDGGLICAFGGNNTAGPIDVATARTAHAGPHGRLDFESETFIAHTLRGEGFDASEDGTGRGTPLVAVSDVATTLRSRDGAKGVDSDCTDTLIPIAFNAREDLCVTGPVTGSLGSSSPQAQAIAFSCKDSGGDAGEISPTLRAMGHSGSHANAGGQVAVAYGIASDALDRTGEGAGGTAGERSGLGVTEELLPALKARAPHAIAFSLRGRAGEVSAEVERDAVSPAIRTVGGGSSHAFVAFDETQITSKANYSNPKLGDPCHPLAATARAPTLASPMAVRRITCVEAEILQGFPPNFTLIDWPTANRKGDDLAETIAYLRSHGLSEAEATALAQTPDGPRYKGIGNSWAVPVVRWIGERIALAMPERRAAA